MPRIAKTSQAKRATPGKTVQIWTLAITEWFARDSLSQPSLWTLTSFTSIRPHEAWVSTPNSASNPTKFSLWPQVSTLETVTEEPSSIFLESSQWGPTISYTQTRSTTPCSVVVVTASSSCHVTPTTNSPKTIVTKTLSTISPKESTNSKVIMLEPNKGLMPQELQMSSCKTKAFKTNMVRNSKITPYRKYHLKYCE